MNECHFIGRFAADPILEYANDGNVPRTRFTLAVNRQYKTSNGERGEHTQFIDFEVWDSAAELIGNNCHRGELLIIDRASACSRRVTLVDGSQVNHVVFRVDKFSLQSSLFGRRNKKDDDE